MERRPIDVSVNGWWFAAWMFTLGTTAPGFWRSILDLFIWPYSLGRFFFGG